MVMLYGIKVFDMQVQMPMRVTQCDTACKLSMMG